MRNNKMLTASICAVLLGAMTAFHVYCDTTSTGGQTIDTSLTVVAEASQTAGGSSEEASQTAGGSSEKASQTAGSSSEEASVSSGTTLDVSKMFSTRDLKQTADLSGASYVTVSDGETVTISTAGVYVVSGSASNAQILVAAGDEDKVQIVLDGVSITNESTPCIYVKNADKVFVTTAADSENSLSVTGSFSADGTTNTDAVIFSRDDVVLNGRGTLNISSSKNGISSKDDLKVTGGTLNITCTADALEANESIRIADGTVTIRSDKDGLHAENDEDSTAGFIYIGGGTISITAGDDAIHATTLAQIDAGTIDLTAAEGIEGTFIRVNDGSITIAASDDGINAGQKSGISTPTVEINGGELTVTMGAGDTDAIDSNGNLILNGGSINITAQSPFDYDGSAENNGATIIVNGTQTDTITNQMMGGHGGGGMGGWGGGPGRGGMGGHGGHNGW